MRCINSLSCAHYRTEIEPSLWEKWASLRLSGGASFGGVCECLCVCLCVCVCSYVFPHSALAAYPPSHPCLLCTLANSVKSERKRERERERVRKKSVRERVRKREREIERERQREREIEREREGMEALSHT